MSDQKQSPTPEVFDKARRYAVGKGIDLAWARYFAEFYCKQSPDGDVLLESAYQDWLRTIQ